MCLNYKAPFDWESLLSFFQRRQINANEYFHQNGFDKVLTIEGHDVLVKVEHEPKNHRFVTRFSSEYSELSNKISQAIIVMLDLNASPSDIRRALLLSGLIENQIQPDVRIPSIINRFEAGCRAILGQQVSVQAAVKNLNALVDDLTGGSANTSRVENPANLSLCAFPNPSQVLASDLSMLRMPQKRKETLHSLAQAIYDDPDLPTQDWIKIKGIGPWTVNYVKLRNSKNTDIWLDSDLIIKKRIKHLRENNQRFEPERSAPWRSYLTLSLWNLSDLG